MGGISAIFVIFLSLSVLTRISVSGAGWSYTGADGPAFWKNSYADCGARSQSPINIYEGDVTRPGNLGAFSLSGYDTTGGITWTLSNNGHAAVVGYGGATALTASGGGLPGTFKVAQFHFHWGADVDKGSEHLISTHMFPMELHIVHYNMAYDNISVALTQPDGLAVLGFMFEVSNAANSNYDDIVNNLEAVKEKDASTSIPVTRLRSLIPDNLSNYFRYSGSLTTPGCYESVTWTVFKETIKISPAQLEQFRLIHDGAGAPIVDNYRPVQPINNREVQASFNPDVHWGYLNNDADHWSDYYEACGARSQSPINIPSSVSELDETIPAFQFNKYDTTEGMTMTLINNGHTVYVGYHDAGENPAINGGGLSENYQTAQFHLHWGSTSMKGSEHKVDNQAYPMELHIVHYKSSLGGLSTAATTPEGLAVLGYFFHVQTDDNPALDPLINAIPNVINPGTSYNLTTRFTLDSILPAARSDFYRYSGSLTTPGCYETVIWTVFNDHIYISERQLNVLRGIKSSETENNVRVDLVDNYRPVQPINGRIIKRTFTIASPHWTYEGSHGVDYWSQDYPSCGNVPDMSRQSPIDLVHTQMKFQDISDITFSGYNSAVNLELSNNGHSVVATVKSGELKVSGGGFFDTYKAAQFHFHWGSSDSRGSEHLINSKAYPMELHIVHYGMRYGELGVAAVSPSGLAVLGFMFEVSTQDNPLLNPIINNLDEIRDPKSKYDIPTPVALSGMLPSSLGDFYRYSGSLTTPGCHESVQWTVFRNPIKISASQLAKFRDVLSSDMDQATSQYIPLVNNYRPTQPINGRIVYANFKLDPDSAMGVKASIVACVLGLIFALILKA